MVALRLVLSVLSAAGLVAAAPTQAVFGLAIQPARFERAPTQATISQASTTALDDHDDTRIRGLRFVSQHRLARVNAIAERILNAAPAYDIVALQELWLKSDHALVAEIVAPVLPHSTVFYSGAFGSGLSLFSRFPIEQAQMHPFALAGDPIDVLGVTGKPLDNVARRHLGKRLDYVLYRGPDAQVEWELIAKEAKVVMTELELELALAGVSTYSGQTEFDNEITMTNTTPTPAVPPPVARTPSYAAAPRVLTTGLACAFSLLALAVAAEADEPESCARREETVEAEGHTPLRLPSCFPRIDPHTLAFPSDEPAPPSGPVPIAYSIPSSQIRVVGQTTIQAPWWLGIVLVLAGALLAAAGTTLLYAAVLFGRWERNAIWDVIDQMGGFRREAA
ncbi:hypothetical protein RhiLY_08231 [Ceratobasidium sp. AG-Ba]|nr:hypothetical protein RhiLY_08231 [Ceratobasidium sp. AG-Ba]